MEFYLILLPDPSEHLWPEDNSEQLGIKQLLLQRLYEDESNRQAGP